MNSSVITCLIVLIFSISSTIIPGLIIVPILLLISKKHRILTTVLILVGIFYGNIFIANIATLDASNSDTIFILAKYQDYYEGYSPVRNIFIKVESSEDLNIFSKVEISGNFELNDFSSFYAISKNSYFTIRPDHIEVISEGIPFLLQIKQAIQDSINFNLSKDSSDLAKSLLFGDSSFVSKELKENFKEIGALHILALSGYNFILILSLIDGAMFFVDKRKRGIFTIAIGVVYLLIAGVTNLSGLRALLFFAINTLLNYFGAYASPMKIVLMTILFFLILNPFNIYNFSIALSYLANFGVIVASKIKSTGIGKVMIEQLLVMLFTLPAVSLLSNSFNLLSVVFNIVLTPLTSVASLLLVVGQIFVPLLKVVEILLGVIIELTETFAQYSLKLTALEFMIMAFAVITILYKVANIYKHE